MMNGSEQTRTSTTTELTVRPAWRHSLSQCAFVILMLGSVLVRVFLGADSSFGSAWDAFDRVFELSVTVICVLCLIALPGALVASRRRAARLDGATLIIASPFGTRRADLAVARVRIKHHTLMADDGSPRAVRLGLFVPGKGALPPDQLVAVADALRPTPGQSPETHRQHWQVAADLHELATNPSRSRPARASGWLDLTMLLIGTINLALALLTVLTPAS